MKKIINYCGNCPFGQMFHANTTTTFDPIPTSKNETIYKCSLALFLNLDNIEINIEFEEKLTTPDWCPLKEEQSFLLRKFSDERINNINIVKKEMEDQRILMKSTNDIIASDASYKLQITFSKLNNLLENEETLDINKSIEEIKNQLNSLGDVSYKLQDMLNKFNNL